MKIFLSWSGEASHKLALALKEWLPSVLPTADPWISSEDIPKGRRWGREIDDMLEQTSFCVVCVTPTNSSAPWVNFEAGAIAKVVEDAHVSPLLLGLEPGELGGLPLGLFQATKFEKADVFRLLRAMNTASEGPIPDDRLKKNVDLCWAGLADQVREIESAEPPELSRPSDENGEGDLPPLRDVEKRIIAFVALRTDSYPAVSAVAQAAQESEVKTKYFLDKLEKRSLVRAHYSMNAPVRYSITEEGRAYAVENDLVD